MNKITFYILSAFLMSACAAARKGPDLEMRFYRASQKVGEKIPEKAAMKKQSDQVLLLNITPGAEKRIVTVDKIEDDSGEEIEGQVRLTEPVLTATEDGLISGLVYKDISVVGLKLTPSIMSDVCCASASIFTLPAQSGQKNARKSLLSLLFRRKSSLRDKESPGDRAFPPTFEPREMIYLSPRTTFALKNLSEKHPFNRILVYRILAVQKPEQHRVWTKQDWRRGWLPTAQRLYSPTRVRLYVRLIDADTGLVLYSDHLESQY